MLEVQTTKEMKFKEFYLIGYDEPLEKEIKVNVEMDVFPLANCYNFDFTNRENLSALASDEFHNHFLVIWDGDSVGTKNEAMENPAHYLLKV